MVIGSGQYRSWSQEFERPGAAQATNFTESSNLLFDVILSQTLAEARAKGIQIIGDMPMFVFARIHDV